jgi:hypothetical protein
MVNEEYNLNDKISMTTGKGLIGSINPNANMRLELRDKDGNLKDVREVHNTVTSAGKYGLMDQVLGTPTLQKLGWMELGTGTGGTTLLNAYATGSRTAFTSKTRLNAVVTVVADFAAGVGTGAITEAGVFDVVTQNTVNMWMYATFSVINKGINDSLSISWTLTAS